MAELLLPFVPVGAALAAGFGVSSYMRRGVSVEPADIETLAAAERDSQPHGRAESPDAAGANGVALDEDHRR